MSETAQTEKIEELMAEIENTIGALYHEYADNFPEQSEFWLKIFKKELVHAQWVMILFSEVKNGKLKFDKNKFTVSSLKNYLHDLKKIISEAEKNKTSILEALNIALKFEHTIIERNLFKVFHGDSPDIKHVLDGLEQDKLEYIELIEKKISEIKAMQNIK